MVRDDVDAVVAPRPLQRPVPCDSLNFPGGTPAGEVSNGVVGVVGRSEQVTVGEEVGRKGRPVFAGRSPMMHVSSFMVDEVRGVGGDGRKQRVTQRRTLLAHDKTHGPVGAVGVAGRGWAVGLLGVFAHADGDPHQHQRNQTQRHQGAMLIDVHACYLAASSRASSKVARNCSSAGNPE